MLKRLLADVVPPPLHPPQPKADRQKANEILETHAF
jgi:hypothetical protein